METNDHFFKAQNKMGFGYLRHQNSNISWILLLLLLTSPLEGGDIIRGYYTPNKHNFVSSRTSCCSGQEARDRKPKAPSFIAREKWHKEKARAHEGVRLRFRQDSRRKSLAKVLSAGEPWQRKFLLRLRRRSSSATPPTIPPPARNPPLRPSNLSLPSRPYFSPLFLSFVFPTSLLTKQLKNQKLQKIKLTL